MRNSPVHRLHVSLRLREARGSPQVCSRDHRPQAEALTTRNLAGITLTSSCPRGWPTAHQMPATMTLPEGPKTLLLGLQTEKPLL